MLQSVQEGAVHVVLKRKQTKRITKEQESIMKNNNQTTDYETEYQTTYTTAAMPHGRHGGARHLLRVRRLGKPVLRAAAHVPGGRGLVEVRVPL